MTLLAWVPAVCVALLLSVPASNNAPDLTLTALVGTEVLLPCEVTKPNITLVQLSWKKGTEGKAFVVYNPRIGMNASDKRYSSRIVLRNNSLQDGSILLKALELQDEGMYTCEVTLFPKGIQTKSMNLTIIVSPRNRATKVPAQAGLSEVPVANCTSADGNPAAKIMWISSLHGNWTTTQSENNNGTKTVTSLYKMAPTHSTDGQTVICVISHPASNSSESYTVKLSILYSPIVTIKHSEGNGGLNLTCDAKANPPATNYSWQELPEGMETNTKTVFIKAGTILMNGNCTCEATNSIGSGKGTFQINSNKGNDGFLTKVIIAVACVCVIVIVLTVALMWTKQRIQETGVHGEINNSQTQVGQEIVYASLDLHVPTHTSAQRVKEEETLYADVKHVQTSL
ncbi:nectin-1-like isoform X2 [Scyliorhinus canicula]|uniref:nectin-1-like isoform X2 n=1 Tax=Scyliorhinus canicula TaxID=7830 RepID=UPI0018F74971|nr:nectin-1-like isoform X2 [Scyliorhinus canicula]